jgi:alpha-N-arabinofuranosidase
MEPLIRWVEDNAPRLEVFTDQRREQAISPRLFGKFTEHLGRNVYHGIWAQVLVNPGLEPTRFFQYGGRPPAETLPHHLAWWGVSEAVTRPLSRRLEESLREGVAYGWMRTGDGEARYALDPDRVNSETSQRIEVRSPRAGVAQPIFLPLHRQRRVSLSVWAKGDAGNLYASIRTADERRVLAEGRVGKLTKSWCEYTLRLSVDTVGIERGELLVFALTVDAPGTVWIDQCFLFPADNVSGFDVDAVKALKQAKLPLLRFPGGNFVSGYHWEDGVGPIDDRPLRPNPAWHDVVEYNHVGTDEYMALCKAVGCEPLICINAGNGTPEEAARWVEYCNGSTSTPQGRRRAANGHPEPYRVRYWEIGNELWGDWQIGHCTREEYADRYRRFVQAMKAVDPTIEVIACGQDAHWNEPLIERCADILRSLSIHTLIAHSVPPDTPTERIYRSIAAFPVWYEGHLAELGRQMARRVKPPRIAITELQIMTPHRVNNQTITEAVYLSGIINTSIRLGDLVELITHSALMNHGGGLRKHREFVWKNPVQLAHEMYAHLAGRIPIGLTVTSPTFSVAALHDLPAVEKAPYLDAVAAMNADGSELTLMVTNRHPDSALTTDIVLRDFVPRGAVSVHTLAGDSPTAQNSFEQPDAVRMVKGTARAGKEGLRYTFPPLSLNLLTFRRGG